jgi:hypothetical protein
VGVEDLAVESRALHFCCGVEICRDQAINFCFGPSRK